MGQCGHRPRKGCSCVAKNAKLLLRRSGGKGDAHVGSLAVDGVDFDLALVLRENLAGDGKTETCAARLAGAGLIHPEKAVENVIQGILRNPDSGIRHLDVKILVVRIQRDPHPAARIQSYFSQKPSQSN
mgnify:CR=1 FL=1